MRYGRILACASVIGARAVHGQAVADTAFRDTSAVSRIVREALDHGQVMDHAFQLTDVYGPRLTGTPAFRAAGEWAVGRLRQLGIPDVRQERVDWGRGWSAARVSIRLLEPQVAVLLGTPGVWSSGTTGEIRGEPILAPVATDLMQTTYEDYVNRFRGKLRGKIVLLSPPRQVVTNQGPISRRFTDDELERLARAQPSSPSPASPDSLVREFRRWGLRLNQFWHDEGVLALVHQSRGDGGMVVSVGPDWARDTIVALPPTVYLAAEHYARITRLLDRGVPVRLGIDMRTTMHRDPANAFNVIGEMRGTTRPNEIVMIGAHLDSWAGGTGATDDAAGCAMIMEAMRILTTLGLKPDRTIRIALWAGHEGGGHLGSLTYLRHHFQADGSQGGDPERLVLYANVDNGGGRIRGVYLPRRFEADRERIVKWLTPLAALGAANVITVAQAQGSDHESFYTAGLPAVMFAQDPLDYATRTRHSNMDLYDRLQPDDLRQGAAVVAAFLYLAATEK